MSTQRIQLAYTVTPLGAAAVFTAPLTGAGVADFLQIARPPLNVLATAYPVAYEKHFIRGFVDVDQAGTLRFFFSDDRSTTRVTVTFAIPANAAGAGSTFQVLIPGGKYVQLQYTNGAVAQARFALLANLEESEE